MFKFFLFKNEDELNKKIFLEIFITISMNDPQPWCFFVNSTLIKDDPFESFESARFYKTGCWVVIDPVNKIIDILSLGNKEDVFENTRWKKAQEISIGFVGRVLKEEITKQLNSNKECTCNCHNVQKHNIEIHPKNIAELINIIFIIIYEYSDPNHWTFVVENKFGTSPVNFLKNHKFKYHNKKGTINIDLKNKQIHINPTRKIPNCIYYSNVKSLQEYFILALCTNDTNLNEIERMDSLENIV